MLEQATPELYSEVSPQQMREIDRRREIKNLEKDLGKANMFAQAVVGSIARAYGMPTDRNQDLSMEAHPVTAGATGLASSL